MQPRIGRRNPLVLNTTGIEKNTLSARAEALLEDIVAAHQNTTGEIGITLTGHHAATMQREIDGNLLETRTALDYHMQLPEWRERGMIVSAGVGALLLGSGGYFVTSRTLQWLAEQARTWSEATQFVTIPIEYAIVTAVSIGAGLAGMMGGFLAGIKIIAEPYIKKTNPKLFAKNKIYQRIRTRISYDTETKEKE